MQLLKKIAKTILMHRQGKIWQELLWCTFKQKYGKSNFNAPSNKNMARIIVMHLQVKIRQEPLLATVGHCLLKWDAKEWLFRMLRYSFSFRDGLVGFSRNLVWSEFLRNLRPLLAAFRGCNSHVLFPLTLTLFQQQPSQLENRRAKTEHSRRRLDWRHVWRKTSTAK